MRGFIAPHGMVEHFGEIDAIADDALHLSAKEFDGRR